MVIDFYNNINFELYKYGSCYKAINVKWVDPDSIQYITGRPWKAWNNRIADIGTAQDGDWDKIQAPGAPDYQTRSYAEYAFHTSARAHFEDGVPWTDTEMYKFKRERGESHSKAIETLSRLDTLRDVLEQEGYKSQKELYLEYNGQSSVFSSILNEILVDVGRNGELLFVDGRHRLTLAKILDVDEIPVVPIVRHQQYIDSNNSISGFCKSK